MTQSLMTNEEMYWKSVVAYLASFQAATLELLPKSAPKSSRKRHVNICREAAGFLRGTRMPHFLGQDSNIIYEAITRCDNAVEIHDAHS